MRFISADSLVKQNLYCYCSNLPIIGLDENGHEIELNRFEGDETFLSIILPRIIEFIEDPALWGYNKNTIHKPIFTRSGKLKTPGDIACGHLMIKITKNGKQLSAPGRYEEAKRAGIAHGNLFDRDGNLVVELRVGMEVYKPSYKIDPKTNKRIKVDNGHVGFLIRYDFGDGMEWAVFQSASVDVTHYKTSVAKDPNHGPIITSFYRNDTEDKESEWVNYTGQRY